MIAAFQVLKSSRRRFVRFPFNAQAIPDILPIWANILMAKKEQSLHPFFLSLSLSRYLA